MLNLAIAAGAAFLLICNGAFAQGTVTSKGPDLVPVPDKILNGMASVRNAGSGDSPPSVLTVQCQKQGGGSCAETPAMAAYEDPAYPGRLVIQVPATKAGQTRNFKLKFWKDLVWADGSYNFLLEADAGKAVAETNEGNNFGGAVLTKP